MSDETSGGIGPVTVKVADLPIPVVIAGSAATGARKQDQVLDPSLPARTTYQEDLTTEGQRRVNLIWEYTQSFVTLLVVLANMIVAVYNGIMRQAIVAEHPAILSSALFLILGFYYSRTNHAAIGGVGNKPEAKYEGR
jgi:hypothetical protein